MEKNNIFKRAELRNVSWQEQAYLEGLSIDQIQKAESLLDKAEEQFALAAHNEGAGHEAYAEELMKKFWAALSVT